jgi:hypothetical protein
MRNLMLVGLVLLCGTPAHAADPAADWKLPKPDAEKWVARLKKLARDGWTVTVRGNEITVAREKPAPFVELLPNSPADAKPMPAGDRTVKYVLVFAPKVSTEEYEKLAEVNEASDRERDRLTAALKLPGKFGDFVATTPEEKIRLQGYRVAVSKLPRHTLPDLYTPEHSVFFFQTGGEFMYVADRDARAECDDMRQTLLRYFGVYDPAAASNNTGVGRYLPDPR